mmetsp:Transcript_36605/g.105269  ORF Transcript_36605/g.105269 Transcript_36605/m.105269 type:complete len:206 (+) Transcript_36605:315-932(+)
MLEDEGLAVDELDLDELPAAELVEAPRQPLEVAGHRRPSPRRLAAVRRRDAGEAPLALDGAAGAAHGDDGRQGVGQRAACGSVGGVVHGRRRPRLHLRQQLPLDHLEGRPGARPPQQRAVLPMRRGQGLLIGGLRVHEVAADDRPHVDLAREVDAHLVHEPDVLLFLDEVLDVAPPEPGAEERVYLVAFDRRVDAEGIGACAAAF